MKHLFSLANKTIVITGGNGHLGMGMARGLADFGGNVIITGRSINVKVPPSPELEGSIKYFCCDATDQEAFKRLLEEIGEVDVLINNAFREERQDPEVITKDSWEVGMTDILTQVFFCSQAVLPSMLKRGKGSIINISSIYGFLGTDQKVFNEVKSPSIFYSVAKGGMLQLTRRLATEYGSKGIRVNAISPGAFPKQKKGQVGRPGYIVNLSSKAPMQRTGSPEELAGAAVYLASDASSFVTGQNLVVDGGWSVW